MIFFHMLVLTYSIGQSEIVSTLVFRDQSSCANAMDEIFPTVQAEYFDSMAQCVPSDTPSSYTIRPKARPKK